jgi:hypothetical protein
MKNHIKITFFLLLLCATLVSCKKDFLDIIPKGEQVAATTNDYNLLMNSKDFYLYENGGGWQAPMWMGDDIAAEATDFSSNSTQAQRLFRWEDVIYQPTDYPGDLTYGLSNLYTCNKIINEVLKSTDGTEQQKKSLRAEAVATRAFQHFLFVNFYAKPYFAPTAATDPGFPIITTADITTKSFKRNTIQEVYDFIINDLTTAIADLPVQNTIRTRMSKPAAEGLLGKVYLFMGKYAEALPLFNAAFTDLATSSDPPRLYDYNVELATGGSFLPIGFYGPNSPGNNYNDITESVLAKTFYGGSFSGGNGVGNNGLILTPQVVALYGTSDWRLQFYSATYQYGSPNPNGRLRKYGVQYIKFGLQLSELYLLRAECKARLNDLTGAKNDVEVLRKCRMPLADAGVPLVIATDQTALIKFILDERIREFAAEGYRWFDMRRLSVDPNANLSGTVKNTHTLYDASGTTTVYTLSSARLILRFPQSYIDSNSGMENNP